MSTVGSKKRYTSAMEKIIKNAVSETSKVLETIIAELKAEVLRVKNENENLKIRCSQFEEVLKKRSVYRETGTSPEPYIIEKCDKAVQCDLVTRQAPIVEQDPVMFVLPNQDVQNDNDEPNLSENETQESENSFGLINDKESSNDSFSFLKLKEVEHNACSQADLDLSSNETKPEESLIDHEYATSEDMLVDEGCLEPQLNNIENSKSLETQNHSSEPDNLTTALSVQDNLHKEPEICYEISEMETEKPCQEDELDFSQKKVDIEFAKTDLSLLECQDKKEAKEQTNLFLQEDIQVSQTEDDVNNDKLKTQIQDSNASPLPDLLPDFSPCHESARSPDFQHQAAEETTEVDVQIDGERELSSSEIKTDNATAADTTNGISQHTSVHSENTVSTDVSTVSNQTITPPKDTEDIEATVSLPESEQPCTKIDDEAVQAVPIKDTPAVGAQKSSKIMSTPVSCILRRRQRCTSVTLEDAMLLLDAVNQQKYKPSSPKKVQRQDSPYVTNVDTSQTVNNPEVSGTVSVKDNASNYEENAHTMEQIEPETAGVIESDVCLANSATPPTELSSTIEPTDHTVPMSTPTKQDETTQVEEVEPIKMDIEGEQHDNKILSATSSPKLPSTVEPATDDMSPMLTPTKHNETPTKLDEITQAIEADPTNMAIEDQQHDQQTLSTTPPPKPSPAAESTDHTVSILTPTKQDEITQVVEANVCSADMDIGVQQDEYKTMSATSSTNSLSNVEPAVVHTAPIPTPTTQPHNDSEVKEPDLSLPTDNTVSSAPVPQPSPPLNPSTHHTLLLKMPTDKGEQSCPVFHKTITSPQTLSSAQLTAVVSAVRSTQNTNLPKGLSANTPSGKRTLIAVPFSLQSVVKPHHKIIVIPRQCKVPFSQAMTKEKAIILKKKLFTADPTTYTVNTAAAVNSETSGECNTTVPQEKASASNNMDLDKQSALVTKPTQSPPETSALEIEPVSSEPVKPQCKNTVKVKLSRLPFPVSPAQSVSVTNILSSRSSKTNVRKTAKRSVPVKAPIFPKDSSQSEAQLVKEKLTSAVGIIGPSAILQSQEAEPIPPCPVQNVKSTEVNQSATVMRLSPIVSSDHSYPQLCMTKSQFLAKLEVSPVIQVSNKVETVGKDAQKESLVDRLRSHLKPRLQTIRTAQKTGLGLDGSNLTIPDVPAIDTTDATSLTHETSGRNPEQLCENSYLFDFIPNVEADAAVSPRTSSITHKVSSDGQIKRKNRAVSPKRGSLIATKTVKKRRLEKNGTSSENECLTQNMPSSDSSSALRIKILNSNALLSCVRRRQGNKNGVKKKSFLCKFCRKEFSKKKDIEAHLQIHAGKKPFQCNICQRRFSRTMELSRHLKRHNAEKKYQCTFCGKAFIEYNNLKRHSYIHTGEKPFACPHCPKAFTQSGHMKSHVRNKHKDNVH